MESQAVLANQPCEQCGSSDAKCYYDDGHSHCYSCTTTIQSDSSRKGNDSSRIGNQRVERVEEVNRPTDNRELEILQGLWISAKGTSIPERGIKGEQVGYYSVVVRENQHAYPYFGDDTSTPIGFKVRRLDTKAFHVVGDIRTAGLFGQQKYGNHDRRRIVVTEGELDALAARQMLSGKASVVSIKGGAGSTAKDFKASYEFLDGFNEIILCFDADDPGKEGVEKAAEVFAGKLRIMKLDPKIGKDACDYLKSGRLEEFVEAYWSASTYTPKGVMDADDLWERLSADRPAAIGDYPWGPLNELTFGFRPTELVMITAGSGLGKSSILRELVMHIKQTTSHRIGTLFLEESPERTAEGFMSVDLSTPVHLPSSGIKRDSLEYKQSFDRVFRDGQITIMNAAFDTGASVEQIIGRVRYLIKALDCSVIILDHISILVSAGNHGDERKALDEIMTRLRSLSQDTGVVIFAVSHLRRPDGKGHEDGACTALSQLRGSGSIAQLSDFVIGLERNGQADDLTERNTTAIRVLKNRFSGLTGPAGHLLYSPESGRLTEYDPVKEAEEAL